MTGAGLGPQAGPDVESDPVAAWADINAQIPTILDDPQIDTRTFDHHKPESIGSTTPFPNSPSAMSSSTAALKGPPIHPRAHRVSPPRTHRRRLAARRLNVRP